MSHRNWELLIVMAAIVVTSALSLVPMFRLASQINADEWQKGGLGMVLGPAGGLATLITGYKIWKGRT